MYSGDGGDVLYLSHQDDNFRCVQHRFASFVLKAKPDIHGQEAALWNSLQ
jgi:hypothetical protein